MVFLRLPSFFPSEFDFSNKLCFLCPENPTVILRPTWRDARPTWSASSPYLAPNPGPHRLPPMPSCFLIAYTKTYIQENESL